MGDKPEISRKVMLNLFRKIATEIGEIKVSNVTPRIEFWFENDDYKFSITAFDKNNDNMSYTVYNFISLEPQTEKINLFIETLKKDDWPSFLESDFNPVNKKGN